MALPFLQYYFNKFILWRTLMERGNNEDELKYFIYRWECCFMCIQKILIWEDIVVSSFAIVGFNILFWLVVFFEWKFYGLFFFSLFVFMLLDLGSQYMWPQGVCRTPEAFFSESSSSTNVNVLSASELTECAKKTQKIWQQACIRLSSLRRNQPGSFCMITCGCFVMLSIIGRSLSGLMLLYSLIMSAMTIPALCVRYLPSDLFPRLTQSSQKASDSDIEEYLPEPSSGALRILSLAGEQHNEDESNDLLLSSADFISSKVPFMPDASQMPSHENSLDYLGPDIEIPSPRQIAEASDESDNSEHNGINFKAKHFNGSNSGSEEEDFTKGLKFTEIAHTEVDAGLHLTSKMFNLASIGASILSGVSSSTLKSLPTVQVQVDREASSDSDSFEFITKDDL